MKFKFIDIVNEGTGTTQYASLKSDEQSEDSGILEVGVTEGGMVHLSDYDENNVIVLSKADAMEALQELMFYIRTNA